MFQHVAPFAGDHIVSLNEAFQCDPRPHKVNLSIGIYCDENARVPALDAVHQAERRLAAAQLPKPYLPMEGATNFRSAVQTLLFGARHEALASGRVVTVQTVGSSGGLKAGAEFLRRWFAFSGVWISDPSWDNHRSLFESSRITVHSYPYYDPASGGVRFDAMLDCLRALPPRSVVLLHACCHNPTGADLTPAQWITLIALIQERQLLPFLDMAYQGFGDGVESDAFAVRALARAGVNFLVANSFSKSMGLYSERCGALSIVCADAEQAECVLGQLKFTVRQSYFSPPAHGGQIVAHVLGDPALRASWEQDLNAMRDRIRVMRVRLHAALAQRRPDCDFSYLLAQRGMFSYTNLRPEQVDHLRDAYAVYLVHSGRICISGLNAHNVEAVADAFSAVLESADCAA
jgi:aromatic-amino-acid transaminase